MGVFATELYTSTISPSVLVNGFVNGFVGQIREFPVNEFVPYHVSLCPRGWDVIMVKITKPPPALLQAVTSRRFGRVLQAPEWIGRAD